MLDYFNEGIRDTDQEKGRNLQVSLRRMDTRSSPTLLAARAFARNLNILLKTARLYGFEHERTATLFEATWSELRGALQCAGEAGLLLGVSGSQVLLDGMPLEPRPTDRSFAQLLFSAGLSSIHFSSRVTSDDFSRFVRVFATRGPKTTQLATQLKLAFGAEGQPAIRINEIRFVAQDAALAEAGLAAQVVARSLGTEAQDLRAWLEDPQKLLQLVAAAEGARGRGVAPPEGPSPADGSVPPPQEEADTVRIIRLLSQLGRAGSQPESEAERGQAHQQLNELPTPAQMTLTQALTRLAATLPSARPDTPLLLQLAEHIAIRFALERYERGDARINTIVELLDRLKREIKALRKVLRVHEEQMARAGMEVESHADILDRQFWAALPEPAKRKILLSPEAWAIPPGNVRQFVEELLGRGEAEPARAVLLNYATCVHDPAPEARRKASLGLTDLANLYGRTHAPLLRSALCHVGEQLRGEGAAELQTLLSASFVRLSHEAAAHRHYQAVQQALDSMEEVEQEQPFLAQLLRPRIMVGNRLHEFIEEALRAPHLPEGLVDVLQRLPQAAVELMAHRLNHCTRCNEGDRLVALARELGAAGVAQLRNILSARLPSEAASTLALLSRLEPRAIEELLPERLREWDWVYQDQAVRQLACGGAPERGRLLVDLLDLLDPIVLPEALDEIGMSGDRSAATLLLPLLEERPQAPGESFIRLKAIEALGRLREAKAPPLLRPLVEARRLWRWQYPRELRITAAQALGKIDPEWAQSFLPKSGLREAELRLAPLDPAPATPWVRQRRYERIALRRMLGGVMRTPQGRWPMAIQGLSLGGGAGTCPHHFVPGTLTQVELHPGRHGIQAEVLVREARPQHMTFELVNMDLEDRSNLRRPLAELH
jgi:hypothetical protein